MYLALRKVDNTSERRRVDGIDGATSTVRRSLFHSLSGRTENPRVSQASVVAASISKPYAETLAQIFNE
jgi:hypothetical protein